MRSRPSQPPQLATNTIPIPTQQTHRPFARDAGAYAPPVIHAPGAAPQLQPPPLLAHPHLQQQPSFGPTHVVETSTVIYERPVVQRMGGAPVLQICPACGECAGAVSSAWRHPAAALPHAVVGARGAPRGRAHREDFCLHPALVGSQPAVWAAAPVPPLARHTNPLHTRTHLTDPLPAAPPPPLAPPQAARAPRACGASAGTALGCSASACAGSSAHSSGCRAAWTAGEPQRNARASATAVRAPQPAVFHPRFWNITFARFGPAPPTPAARTWSTAAATAAPRWRAFSPAPKWRAAPPRARARRRRARARRPAPPLAAARGAPGGAA